MNRRQFVRATSLIAATGATYMVSPIARAGGYQENLLSTPDLCIGRQFLLDNGTLVTLERVEATTRDSRWQQWELHFSAESELVEGTFTTTLLPLAILCLDRRLSLSKAPHPKHLFAPLPGPIFVPL